MRNELENIEMIERYLMDEMTAEEKNSFETKMNNDAALREAVNTQRELMQGMNRIGLKRSIAKAKMKYKWFKNGTSFGLGAVIVTGLTVGVMWAAGTFNNNVSSVKAEVNNSLPELNENGDSVWADADKYLPSQKFSISANADTVIETKGGIVMVIPANAFLDENGNVVNGTIEYEVKEALDAASIIEAGLETRSGDQLLETGGMFYINARQNGKSLKIDATKGIYTEVPANEMKPGMQLFDGIRKTDGGIDWINPKPLEKELTAVNILDLNFYPPNYLAEVGKLGHDNKNKKFTDSLYYSFADLFGDEWESIPVAEAEVEAVSVNNTTIDKDPITNNENKKRIYPVVDGKIKCDNVLLSVDISQKTNIVEIVFNLIINKDWVVFSSFQPDENGPLAMEINLSHSNKFQKLGKIQETKISSKYFEGLNGTYNYFTGEAQLIQKLKITSVNNFVLKGEFVFMQCINNKCLIPNYIPFLFSVKGVVQADTTLYANDSDCNGINPSKIKAIWNEEFQNTNLATREFEERLKTIHGTCNNSVLDVYVNNLDKNLCSVDSMAAALAGGEYYTFMDFAARGDGRVKIESIHQKKLKEYYEKKAKEYTAEIIRSAKDYSRNNRELDKTAEKKRNENMWENFRRESTNLFEENTINYDEALRQLGKPKYQAVVTNPGWKNVDKYAPAYLDPLPAAVFKSTVRRETLDYTDPLTGKKAEIKYEKMIAKIASMNDYDRLLVYLLPDQLTSFMRMKLVNNQYEEKLNELMKYDLVCVGYKKEQPFYFMAENISPRIYAKVSLKNISRNELNTKLNRLKNISSSAEVISDLDHTDYQISEEKRLKKIKDTEELRNLLMPVVFPCRSVVTDTLM